MSDFTDYIAIIFKKDRTHKLIHAVIRKGKKKGSRKLKNFVYDGIHYKVDESKAYQLHGWYPWLKFRWVNPFMFGKYLYVSYLKNVALFVYREPESGEDNPVEPLINIQLDQLRSPKLERAYITNPLLRNAHKKLKYGAGGSSKIILYIAIGLIILLIIWILWGNKSA